MAKRPLTAAELAAYRDLARAAAKLRRAQEAAEREPASKSKRDIRQPPCQKQGPSNE